MVGFMSFEESMLAGRDRARAIIIGKDLVRDVTVARCPDGGLTVSEVVTLSEMRPGHVYELQWEHDGFGFIQTERISNQQKKIIKRAQQQGNARRYGPK